MALILILILRLRHPLFLHAHKKSIVAGQHGRIQELIGSLGNFEAFLWLFLELCHQGVYFLHVVVQLYYCFVCLLHLFFGTFWGASIFSLSLSTFCFLCPILLIDSLHISRSGIPTDGQNNHMKIPKTIATKRKIPLISLSARYTLIRRFPAFSTHNPTMPACLCLVPFPYPCGIMIGFRVYLLDIPTVIGALHHKLDE